MYIVIVGVGEVGSRTASMLVKEGHDVTIVDQSEAVLDSISLRLDVKTVVGSGISPQILHEADVENADVVIAATQNDEMNVITCFIAKQLGAKRTVARIQNPDYPGYFLTPAKLSTAVKRIVRPKKIGVDVLVNPEVLAAEYILDILSSLFVAPVERLGDGRVQISQFEVERAQITNIPLRNMDFSRPGMIAVIVRSEETIVPGADDTLRMGDDVYVISATDDSNTIGRMFSLPKKPTKNVVIAGGGAVGFRVAEGLEKMGAHVKIIEQDKDRCMELSKKLQKTLVIQGEITSKEYLLEEGVRSADAFIVAAGLDELNILISLLAKDLGASRSVAVVNRQEYIALAEEIGVDVVVSPLLLANNAFVRFIHERRVLSAASFARGEAGAIELPAEAGLAVLGQPLSKIGLPNKTMVGAIIRDNKVLIPNAEDSIQTADRVVLVGLKSALPAAEKLFTHK